MENKYSLLREENDWEGETWNWFIPNIDEETDGYIRKILTRFKQADKDDDGNSVVNYIDYRYNYYTEREAKLVVELSYDSYAKDDILRPLDKNKLRELCEDTLKNLNEKLYKCGIKNFQVEENKNSNQSNIELFQSLVERYGEIGKNLKKKKDNPQYILGCIFRCHEMYELLKRKELTPIESKKFNDSTEILNKIHTFLIFGKL